MNITQSNLNKTTQWNIYSSWNIHSTIFKLSISAPIRDLFEPRALFSIKPIIKQANPDSPLTEDDYKGYFDTGDAIEKILVGENVRLLRQFPDLTATSMVLPYGGQTYSIDLDRQAVNEYLGFKVEELSLEDKSWHEKFSNPYIYDDTNRKQFFDMFVEVK